MKKFIVLIIIFLSYLFYVFCYSYLYKTEYLKINDIKSPVEIVTEKGNVFNISGYEVFYPEYNNQNKILAKKLNMTENEAFIYGNFGKYWSKKYLVGKKVSIYKNNIQYIGQNYTKKFFNSPYCFKDGKPTNKEAFEKQLKSIRIGDFVIVDLDSDNFYPISKENVEKLKNFVVVRKSHIKKSLKKNKYSNQNGLKNFNSKIDFGDIKIIVSDSTTKLIPDRNCSSDICREILTNINQSQKTIDMAIYGYSSTPEIENAIKLAIKRGVKIRLVYDLDSKGNNIYPNTMDFVKLIPNNRSDKNSPEAGNTMHNKFYIFDNKIVITGSANLSHTDMSGYNSNSIIRIKSEDAAKIYLKEFEQMYNGKFHNSKSVTNNNKSENIQIYFSPQDNAIYNGVLPLIKNAKKYIYISAFIITEKHLTEELINAKKRGVDVKIIVDALNASNQHSKHSILRSSGILVKAENSAGKMHSKSIISDDEYLIIGSMNFSKSGNSKNDENMIVLKNKKAAEFYKNFFLYQWNKIPDKWLKYTPRAEGIDSIGSCTDGIDNNYDGFTDLADTACKQ